MTKDDMRREARRALRALSEESRESAARAVCSRFLEWADRIRPAAVLCYAATPYEVGTKAVIERLMSRGAKVAIPKVTSKETRLMEFYVLDSGRPIEDQTKKGVYGIAEAAGDRRALFRAEEVAGKTLCAVVPGLAFDRSGGRLGRGAGFYDRYLSKLKEECRRFMCKLYICGFCFDVQIFDAVPCDKNDVKTDALFFESGAVISSAARKSL